MICTKCQGTEFRLSSLRFRDLERLAVLQYPVRCRQCHHRTYGSWFLALFLLQLRRHHFGDKEQT
ncbi:MAG TPA: hypothetical protein VMD92_05210 [Acidobacteriaceae bacterium]|nr:hypothetical protein [Acidobacteriaceae bacterium]